MRGYLLLPLFILPVSLHAADCANLTPNNTVCSKRFFGGGMVNFVTNVAVDQAALSNGRDPTACVDAKGPVSDAVVAVVPSSWNASNVGPTHRAYSISTKPRNSHIEITYKAESHINQVQLIGTVVYRKRVPSGVCE